MTSLRAPFRLALAGAALAMLPAIVLPAPAVAPRTESLLRHAKLLKSGPAANDTLQVPPEAIKLWFSERVEVGLSRIRLVGAGGRILATGKVSSIPGADAPSLMARVMAPLPPGTYTVQWTAASDDAHPMRGSYSFTVAPRT